MSERFLKLMTNSNTSQFITKSPKAFTLLYFIAYRTNRTIEDCQLNGLEIGEAPIGDCEAMGMTRSEYRAAIKRLTNSQQVAIKTTNKGTVAKLISKTIFDINLFENDQQTTSNVPKNDQQTTTTKEYKNKRIKKIIYTEIFEKFWSHYPHKVGKGKAYESWLKLSDEDHSKCIEVLPAYSLSVKDTEIQYIPHPTTWLNQRRWEDDLEKEIQNIQPVISDEEKLKNLLLTT